MKLRNHRHIFFAYLAALLLVSGCQQTPGAGSSPEPGQTQGAEHAEEGPEPIARTEFTSKLLNFFEFAPLRPGKNSTFLIHLTELATGEPVTEADVKLKIKGPNDKELQTVQAKVGRVHGIYVADVKISTTGTYGIDFVVKNDKVQDTISLTGFEVSDQPPAAEPEDKSAAEPVAFLMEQQWLVNMKLAQAEDKELDVPIHATGRIDPTPNNFARLSSPVAGTLNGTHLPTPGSRVQHGQSLATIVEIPTTSEMAQLRAAQAQAEAARIQTQAQLQAENASILNRNAQASIENARLAAEQKSLAEELRLAESRWKQAQAESERARKVYEVEGISSKELQAIELEAKSAKSEFRQVKAKKDALDGVKAIPVSPLLSSAEGGAGGAFSGGSYTLTAPFSGIVTEVKKSLGEQVAPGETILDIANTRTVWLNCAVYEKDLGRMHDGVTALFTVVAYPEQEFKGKFVHLGEVIDKETRATDACFEVPNEDGKLLLGMQAKVRIPSDQSTRAVVIPKEAIIDRDGKKYVYVLATGEAFERRAVEVAEDFGPQVGIVTGLKPGERVVTQGSYQLFLQETNPAESVPHSHET